MKAILNLDLTDDILKQIGADYINEIEEAERGYSYYTFDINLPMLEDVLNITGKFEVEVYSDEGDYLTAPNGYTEIKIIDIYTYNFIDNEDINASLSLK